MPGTARDHALICRGCWDQMSVPIPIRGPLAVPLRIFGITQSKMNPNICTICERAFRRVKKHRHVPATATILFADIRGYTRLSERMEPVQLSDIVSVFQDQCAQAIWAHDGIVNKQMGDGLMAIFNFPIKIERHAEAGVTAALDIQRRCNATMYQLGRFSPRSERVGGKNSTTTPRNFMDWARTARSERKRKIFLEKAQTWLMAAMRQEARIASPIRKC
jgi:adenylate cyclase